MYGILHIFHRQVERDWPRDFVPELEVSEESHSDVEDADHDHACVQDPIPAGQLLGVDHRVLQGKDHTDPLEGVDRGPEV